MNEKICHTINGILTDGIHFINLIDENEKNVLMVIIEFAREIADDICETILKELNEGSYFNNAEDWISIYNKYSKMEWFNDSKICCDISNYICVLKETVNDSNTMKSSEALAKVINDMFLLRIFLKKFESQ